MTHVEPAALEHLADRARQLEQPQQIRDRHSRAADGVGGVGMREPEFLDEPVQRARLLDGVQVLALDVLDERDGDRGFVGDVADDGRDRLQARHLRGAPAALAGDDLVLRLAARDVRQRPHDDRLHDALGLDRFGELGQRVLAHVDARLVLAAPQQIDGHLAQAAVGRLGRRRGSAAPRLGRPAAPGGRWRAAHRGRARGFFVYSCAALTVRRVSPDCSSEPEQGAGLSPGPAEARRRRSGG